ncbi:MAG TPA: hypothetical protein VNA14_13820 [Mycobacteriales bacterium]|nr:hypothetical protein [Mycobacteriales bacterium]
MAQVVLADPEAAGLDAMLAGLVTAAIADPAKAALLDRMVGTVTIHVPDAEVEVGLRFSGGTCRVESGPIPGSTITLTMPSDVLLELSNLPLLAGMPSLLHPGGRAFAIKVLTGKVRIGGLQHVGLLTQLNQLLSVA